MNSLHNDFREFNEEMVANAKEILEDDEQIADLPKDHYDPNAQPKRDKHSDQPILNWDMPEENTEPEKKGSIMGGDSIEMHFSSMED